MKNIIPEQHHNRHIATIVAGVLAAGGLAYLFATRKHWMQVLEEKCKDLVANELTAKTGVPKETTREASNFLMG